VWFQKISIPPPQRELEILEGEGGRGVKGPGNSRGEEGVRWSTWFPDALQFDIDRTIDIIVVQKYCFFFYFNAYSIT